eukprot:3726359-Amphidinium_carterae.1
MVGACWELTICNLSSLHRWLFYLIVCTVLRGSISNTSVGMAVREYGWFHVATYFTLSANGQRSLSSSGPYTDDMTCAVVAKAKTIPLSLGAKHISRSRVQKYETRSQFSLTQYASQ